MPYNDLIQLILSFPDWEDSYKSYLIKRIPTNLSEEQYAVLHTNIERSIKDYAQIKEKLDTEYVEAIRTQVTALESETKTLIKTAELELKKGEQEKSDLLLQSI